MVLNDCLPKDLNFSCVTSSDNASIYECIYIFNGGILNITIKNLERIRHLGENFPISAATHCWLKSHKAYPTEDSSFIINPQEDKNMLAVLWYVWEHYRLCRGVDIHEAIEKYKRDGHDYTYEDFVRGEIHFCMLQGFYRLRKELGLLEKWV